MCVCWKDYMSCYRRCNLKGCSTCGRQDLGLRPGNSVAYLRRLRDTLEFVNTIDYEPGKQGPRGYVRALVQHLPRGPGEASGTYMTPSYLSPFPHRRFLMSSPSSPALQQLHCLDRSSPDFHDQLCSVLYGEEYKRCAPKLEGDDLVWLLDYLDKVPHPAVIPNSPLKSA